MRTLFKWIGKNLIELITCFAGIVILIGMDQFVEDYCSRNKMSIDDIVLLVVVGSAMIAYAIVLLYYGFVGLYKNKKNGEGTPHRN